MIPVKFSYMIYYNGTTKEHDTFGEFETDLDTFRHWCKYYLLGLLPNGKPPHYRLDDVYCLSCVFSDGRRFIWQQHAVDKYGNPHGGWQKISDPIAKTKPFKTVDTVKKLFGEA